jgi:hypothetical protein
VKNSEALGRTRQLPQIPGENLQAFAAIQASSLQIAEHARPPSNTADGGDLRFDSVLFRLRFASPN